MGLGLKTAIAASVKGKAAALVLAGVLAAGGATGATVAANNGAFGQQVKDQVQTCKQELQDGVHGIGECVSTFAKGHGQQERQQHSQGNPPSNPQDTHGNSGSHGGPPSGTPGASNGQGQGHP